MSVALRVERFYYTLPSLQYLKSCYLPRINHVITTYNTLCSDVKSKALECPSSQSFPPALLRPECQLIALLYHCSKMNCSMVGFAAYTPPLSLSLPPGTAAARSGLCPLLRCPLSSPHLPQTGSHCSSLCCSLPSAGAARQNPLSLV